MPFFSLKFDISGDTFPLIKKKKKTLLYEARRNALWVQILYLK